MKGGSFEPSYEVLKDKRDVVKEIKTAAGKAERVFLSTDPDREGEAISWHILEAAKIPAEKTQRVVFHEITKPAIEAAFEHPGELNRELIEAQETRRVLDRLIGYPLSWFVQGKVARSASAGRVQSVALRLIVEREREIEAFTPQEYWTIHARVAKDGEEFGAKLNGLPGVKKLDEKRDIPDEATANELLAALRRSDFSVKSVKKGERKRRPAPPFTTSSYQQAANNRLGLGAQRSMALAQQLYEGVNIPGQGPVGLITYMRTDSLSISPVARREARRFATDRWGSDHVPEKERVYRSRARGAQEAHEAIRPTSSFRTPESLSTVLNRDQLRAYTLIWQRFMASQLADARYATVAVDIEARESGELRGAFRANAQRLVFAGHLAALGIDATEERADTRNADAPETVAALPELAEGDALDRRSVDGDQHFTEPPPRFTEASLVKALEEEGIGRPSTYASIVQTVLNRAYVVREGRSLVPQELGFAVNDLLVQHMDRYVAVPFTSELEGELDEIASGERDYGEVVRGFWEPFNAALETAKQEARKQVEETDIVCSKCGERNMVLRWSRNGKFLGCSGYPECKNAMPLTEEGEPQPTPDPEPHRLEVPPLRLRHGAEARPLRRVHRLCEARLEGVRFPRRQARRRCLPRGARDRAARCQARPTRRLLRLLELPRLHLYHQQPGARQALPRAHCRGTRGGRREGEGSLEEGPANHSPLHHPPPPRRLAHSSLFTHPVRILSTWPPRPPTRQPRPSSTPTWRGLQSLGGRSPHTIRNYRNDIGHFLRFCEEGGIEPLAITRATFRTYSRRPPRG